MNKTSTHSDLLKNIEDARKELSSISGKYIVLPCGETWIADNHLLTNPKSHDGAILFTNAYKGFMPSIGKGGAYNTGLTDTQARAFEILMNLEPGALSPYNGTFWSDPRRMVKVTKEGLKLDCDNNVNDKLIFLILKAHAYPFGPVVTSTHDIEANPFAQFVIKSDVNEAKNEVSIHELKERAYSRRQKMSEIEARDFLKIYRTKDGKSFKTNAMSKYEVVLSTIYRIIDSDPAGFLETMDSPNFKDLVFVENLIENGLLKLVGIKVFTPEGELVGNNKYEAVQNLKTKEYQDLKISLKEKLDKIQNK